MTAFAPILEAALMRHGTAALEQRLVTPASPAELAALPEDRYLSQMSLRTFRAGLKHAVVDARWPAFEEVFEHFDADACAGMADERIEALLADRRLIRNLPKLRAIRANAAAIVALRAQGGIGAWLGGWPGGEIMALWAELGRRFQQLGGNSGPYFLRMVGKDSFILSNAVVAGLRHWEVLDGEPRTAADRQRVQAAFNGWAAETGRPLCQLSQILALSVDS